MEQRVEHPVARPSQPAPWLGQGRIAAALGHAFAGQRVGHHVARPSPPAPWPGQGQIAAALGRAMMVVVPRVAVGSCRNPHPRVVAGALPVGGQRVARPCQPAPGPGQGRGAAPLWRVMVVMVVVPLPLGGQRAVRPCQPAPGPGQGRHGAPLGRAVVVPLPLGGQSAARPRQPAPGPGQGRSAAPLGRAMLVMVVVSLPLASALHHTWSWRAILEPFGRVPYE